VPVTTGGGPSAPLGGGTGTVPSGSATATTTTLRRQPGTTSPPATASPTITQAYVDGYKAECAALWSKAGPSGKLWDADFLEDPPHVIGECLQALDPSNAWFSADQSVADARAAGKADADSTAEDMTLANRFQNASGLIIYIP